MESNDQINGAIGHLRPMRLTDQFEYAFTILKVLLTQIHHFHQNKMCLC